MPLFSVVIPTHQRPKLLAEAIASVEAQTFTDYELVVIEDELGVGPALTRWRGVEQARGELLCFLDDDDVLLPDHLATLAKLHQPERPAILRTDYYVDDGAGNREAILHASLAGLHPLRAHWRAPHNLMPFAVPRRWTLATPPAPDVPAIEDFHWLSLLLARYPVRAAVGPTCVYRPQPQGRNRAPKGLAEARNRQFVVRELYGRPEVRRHLDGTLYRAQLRHQAWHAARQMRSGRNAATALGLGLPHLDTRGWRELFSTLYRILRNTLK